MSSTARIIILNSFYTNSTDHSIDREKYSEGFSTNLVSSFVFFHMCSEVRIDEAYRRIVQLESDRDPTFVALNNCTEFLHVSNYKIDSYLNTSSSFFTLTGGRSWWRTWSRLCNSAWKSLRSALSQISENEGCWSGRNPRFMALFSTAFNCIRSHSLIMPHQACDAEDNRDTRVASATSQRLGPFNPWAISTHTWFGQSINLFVEGKITSQDHPPPPPPREYSSNQCKTFVPSFRAVRFRSFETPVPWPVFRATHERKRSTSSRPVVSTWPDQFGKNVS